MDVLIFLKNIFSGKPEKPLTVEEEFENRGLDLVSLTESCRDILIKDGKVAAIKHINNRVLPSPPLSLYSTKKFVDQLEQQIDKV